MQRAPIGPLCMSATLTPVVRFCSAPLAWNLSAVDIIVRTNEKMSIRRMFGSAGGRAAFDYMLTLVQELQELLNEGQAE